MPKLLIFISILFTISAFPAQAASISAEQEENIAALSCMELDQHISGMIPSTYSTKLGFYDDPDNISVGTLGFYHYANTLAFWVYKEAEKRGEQEKIQGYRERVAELRLAKAQQRCFE
jgi:hypothetical protein